MSSSDRFPAGLDDIPITATVATESVGTGTRYAFAALHRHEADLETRKTSGFYRGTEIDVDQFVAHGDRDEVGSGRSTAPPMTFDDVALTRR